MEDVTRGRFSCYTLITLSKRCTPICVATRCPRKRRLFAVSEPVLRAAKTSDKDFALHKSDLRLIWYMQNPINLRCGNIYRGYTKIKCDRRTVPLSHCADYLELHLLFKVSLKICDGDTLLLHGISVTYCYAAVGL